VRALDVIEQWTKCPCGSVEMGWSWILRGIGISATPAVESGWVDPMPLGEQKGQSGNVGFCEDEDIEECSKVEDRPQVL